MTNVKIDLTQEDIKKINNCDFYKQTKTIMKSCEDYQFHEVGTVVQIKYKQDGQVRYVSGGDRPYRYLIINKDEGFIFAKRIISTGQPGEYVSCLTIEYPSNYYEIEVEPNMADAMLLDIDYDPLKEEKDYKAKKAKASRMNARKRLEFNSPQEAYDFIKTMKVGDTYYTADTSFGSIQSTYVVKEIKTRPVVGYDPNSKWLSDNPRLYGVNNFKDVVQVILTCTTTEHKWSKYDITLDFYRLINKRIGDENYNYKYITLYKEKPVKVTDII